MDSPCTRLLVSLTFWTACCLPAVADSKPGLRSPVASKDVLKTFELHPDLEIELVAAEPLVADPVAVAFDASGRMWVVEMADYPHGPPEGEKPLSRIRVLEDRDGDGRFEHARLFAEGLLFATGVQPWRDGVIATLAGEVAFLRDTDGDGRADTHETWFTGFKQENPQLRANHPTFGLDNHVYIANGLRGGVVTAVRKGWARNAEPVPINGMDFRFDPLTGRYESVTGNGQFGLTFDDWGNRFVCSNRNPCKHIVLEDRYVKRNRLLAVSKTYHDVSPAGADSRIHAISNTWTTSNLHAGQFTAACGVTIYRGDALGDAFRGNSFTCDPTGNLVHRDIVKPSGATFTSRYARDGVEFLASRDEWFRPVNMALGPDGALYVVDMYRAVIEHPQFMPAELKTRPDLRLGEDRGRIYRIVRRGADRPAGHPRNLASLTTRELVSLLEHANAWQRDTAFRLIYERQDASVADDLAKLARSGKRATSRVHALWALQGLSKLGDSLIAAALDDASPGVRRHAIRLAEAHLKTSEELKQAVLARAEDENAAVRFQAALSLGEAPFDASVADALARLAVRSAADEWTRIAVATSLTDGAGDALVRIIDELHEDDLNGGEAHLRLLEEIASLVGSQRDKTAVARVLERLEGLGSGSAFRIQLAIVQGLGDGLARRGATLAAYARQTKTSATVDALLQRAAATLGDQSQSTALRLKCLNVLKHASYGQAGEVLERLIAGRDEQSLHLGAINVLGGFSAPEVGPFLLDRYESQTPAGRRAILDALLRRTERIGPLLDRIEAGEIAAGELGQLRIRRLLKHKDPALRKRAQALLASEIPADRRKVLGQYQAALSAEASAVRGREVFKKNCMVCHKIGEIGVNVAPDISDSRTKKPADLLTSILDPNRAIDANYFSYSIQTVDGKVETGVIASETTTAVTLRQPEGKTVTILRDDIEQLKSNGVSLMPTGLEKNISVQQMADLIAFIKNWRYLDGQIPIDVDQ